MDDAGKRIYEAESYGRTGGRRAGSSVRRSGFRLPFARVESTGRIPIFTNGQNYDYCIIYDSGTGSTIQSRWFIMEDNRTREGQYELTLKRDVIADNYDVIKDAPIYVEKAYINDATNPLLFNSEGLQVNQIKQQEYPIKDETESGWVVGYVPRNAFTSSTSVDSDVFIPATPDYTVAGIAN